MQSSEREKLIEENMGLVGRVIADKVFNISGVGIYTYDDLFQIGCIGLCKAADSFKPGIGCFSTYSYIFIRNEIYRALEYATLRRNREDITASDDLPTKTYAEFPDGSLSELNSAIDAAQERVSGVIAKGIAAILLLADGYSHREIGERMGGVSANNVSAWVARARKYLRAQPEISALGDFK
jgi:RNA polymerase sigma factor (sigma-70 family)